MQLFDSCWFGSCLLRLDSLAAVLTVLQQDRVILLLCYGGALKNENKTQNTLFHQVAIVLSVVQSKKSKYLMVYKQCSTQREL